MKEIIAAIIAGMATVLAAWLTKKRPKPGDPKPAKSVDAVARYVAFFGAGTVLALVLMWGIGKFGAGCPVGTIVAYMGNSAPDGWLLCDGRDVGITHSELSRIVGDKTPDLRGVFLRGLDPTGKIDPDGENRKPGSPQPDMIKNHQHPYIFWTHVDANGGKSGGGAPDVAGTGTSGKTGDPATGGASETRPKNVAVNYIIKF
jgi:hypothetical protein